MTRLVQIARMKLHRHDYDMEFPYEARPLLAVYVCKHCGDRVLDAATALMKDGSWSMRSGPEHVWITGERGRWTVHYSGATTFAVGPYRYRWAAVFMKWVLEDH